MIREPWFDGRFEIGVLIGPCGQDEAETLALTIANLPEVRALGGAISLSPWDEDEELRAANSHSEPSA